MGSRDIFASYWMLHFISFQRSFLSLVSLLTWTIHRTVCNSNLGQDSQICSASFQHQILTWLSHWVLILFKNQTWQHKMKSLAALVSFYKRAHPISAALGNSSVLDIIEQRLLKQQAITNLYRESIVWTSCKYW